MDVEAGRRAGAVRSPEICLTQRPEVTRRAPAWPSGTTGAPDAWARRARPLRKLSGRGLCRVQAAGKASFAVDEQVAAVPERGGGCVEGACRPVGVAVHGHMAALFQEPAEDRDAPQARGGHDDGLDAEASQGGEDDARVGQRGVVGDDDAARGGGRGVVAT
ncbi:hypothetical protein SBADM41S_06508 [Streptomyces badius]